MRHDDPSMIDLVTAMDLVPGVSTFWSERDIQQAERFSVSFTVKRTPIGFRALELLIWACSEMAYAQRGRVEVKASYRVYLTRLKPRKVNFGSEQPPFQADFPLP